MNYTFDNSNSVSTNAPAKRTVPLVAAAMAILLGATSLTGCAHRPRGGGHPLSGNFIAPAHQTIANMSSGNQTTVTITVKWKTVGNCTFKKGKVSLYLQKPTSTQPYYCGTKEFTDTSAGALNTEPVTFTFTGESASTGVHYVLCYISGELSDGPIADYSHGHGTDGHCLDGVHGQHGQH